MSPYDDDFSTICFLAFRYAIGRMTYAPAEVQRIIRDNFKRIDPKILSMIRSEIHEAIEKDRAGDPRIDVPHWKSLECWLDEVLKSYDADSSSIAP